MQIRITLAFVLALICVARAQEDSSNLMDQILATISNNVAHAIPTNTIPPELAASNITDTSSSSADASASAEAEDQADATTILPASEGTTESTSDIVASATVDAGVSDAEATAAVVDVQVDTDTTEATDDTSSTDTDTTSTDTSADAETVSEEIGDATGVQITPSESDDTASAESTPDASSPEVTTDAVPATEDSEEGATLSKRGMHGGARQGRAGSKRDSSRSQVHRRRGHAKGAPAARMHAMKVQKKAQGAAPAAGGPAGIERKYGSGGK